MTTAVYSSQVADSKEVVSMETGNGRERTVQEIYDSVIATRTSLLRLYEEMAFVVHVSVMNAGRTIRGEAELEIFKSVPDAAVQEAELRLLYSGLSGYFGLISNSDQSSKIYLEGLEERYKAMEKVANLALNRFAHRLVLDDTSLFQDNLSSLLPLDFLMRKYFITIGKEPLSMSGHRPLKKIF
jgi:hypothetical protein